MAPRIGGARTGDSPTARLAERVHELRSQRGWSLQRLAEQSSVSRSMLSQVERGEVNPTVAVALAVATALGVTLDELLETGRNKPRITFIRADDTQFVYRSDEQCTIRTLSPLHPERTLEFYEITLQPLAELRSAPHFSGTVEYLTVRSGAVRVESGVDRVDLGRGDSVEYPADVPHAIVNRRRSVAVVYLIDFALAGQ